MGRAEWQQLVSVPSSVSCGRLTRAGGSLPPHADKLVLPVGFSPHGPHLGWPCLLTHGSWVLEVNVPRNRKWKLLVFSVLNSETGSVISIIIYWSNITEIGIRNVKEFWGHVLKLTHYSKGFIVCLFYFTLLIHVEFLSFFFFLEFLLLIITVIQ